MGFFTKIKDKTSSWLGEKFLREKIERYGDMLDLKIDSKNNSIFVSILLKGESEPVDLTITSYSFTQEANEDYIVIDGVNISREWMNLLAKDYLQEKKFKLPEGIASALIKMVM